MLANCYEALEDIVLNETAAERTLREQRNELREGLWRRAAIHGRRDRLIGLKDLAALVTADAVPTAADHTPLQAHGWTHAEIVELHGHFHSPLPLTQDESARVDALFYPVFRAHLLLWLASHRPNDTPAVLSVLGEEQLARAYSCLLQRKFTVSENGDAYHHVPLPQVKAAKAHNLLTAAGRVGQTRRRGRAAGVVTEYDATIQVITDLGSMVVEDVLKFSWTTTIILNYTLSWNGVARCVQHHVARSRLLKASALRQLVVLEREGMCNSAGTTSKVNRNGRHVGAKKAKTSGCDYSTGTIGSQHMTGVKLHGRQVKAIKSVVGSGYLIVRLMENRLTSLAKEEAADTKKFAAREVDTLLRSLKTKVHSSQYMMVHALASCTRPDEVFALAAMTIASLNIVPPRDDRIVFPHPALYVSHSYFKIRDVYAWANASTNFQGIPAGGISGCASGAALAQQLVMSQGLLSYVPLNYLSNRVLDQAYVPLTRAQSAVEMKQRLTDAVGAIVLGPWVTGAQLTVHYRRTGEGHGDHQTGFSGAMGPCLESKVPDLPTGAAYSAASPSLARDGLRRVLMNGASRAAAQAWALEGIIGEVVTGVAAGGHGYFTQFTVDDEVRMTAALRKWFAGRTQDEVVRARVED